MQWSLSKEKCEIKITQKAGWGTGVKSRINYPTPIFTEITNLHGLENVIQINK